MVPSGSHSWHDLLYQPIAIIFHQCGGELRSVVAESRGHPAPYASMGSGFIEPTVAKLTLREPAQTARAHSCRRGAATSSSAAALLRHRRAAVAAADRRSMLACEHGADRPQLLHLLWTHPRIAEVELLDRLDDSCRHNQPRKPPVVSRHDKPWRPLGGGRPDRLLIGAHVVGPVAPLAHIRHREFPGFCGLSSRSRKRFFCLSRDTFR